MVGGSAPDLLQARGVVTAVIQSDALLAQGRGRANLSGALWGVGKRSTCSCQPSSEGQDTPKPS